MEEQAVATTAGAVAGGILFVYTILAILMIASVWRLFSKAGQPGWAAIIPIFNVYIMLKVAGRPGWWLLLMLIPLVNIVIGIIVTIDLATRFGKGGGYAVGLIFLPVIFLPMLAFGSSTYVAKPPALS